MTKSKSLKGKNSKSKSLRSQGTKRALHASIFAVLLCVVMLIGTTFAWFTDTASTAVNKIQAGTLKVGLQMMSSEGSWVDAEGTTLEFKKAERGATQEVLWEPGCTYELPAIRVVNNGNLAFKYKLVVSGAVGDTELLDAIEFTVTYSDGNKTALKDMEGIILPEGSAATTDDEKVHYSDENGITIKGYMKEDAGNEYQGRSVSGIAVTVYAEQYTYEYDSYNKTYDEKAEGVITNSPFSDYVKVTANKAAEGDTTLTDNATITATLPADSLDTDVSGLALIKEPTANPDNVTVDLGENAVSTDVRIIDTSTQKTVTAQGDTFFTIDIQLGQVELLKFYHKGVELEYVDSNAAFTKSGQYKYDFTSGVVTFTTKDFSAFTAKIKYSGGKGTQEFPYLLSTANDLSGLAKNAEDCLGKSFKVLNDIELPADWTAIDKFKGTIDGNGKTIKFSGTQGLFTDLNSGSTIKNLTLESYTAENALLAYLAHCSSTAPTTISDVTINGSVSYVAAMIGWLYTEGSGSSDTTEAYITNCTNNAAVNGDGGNRAAGLVGTVKTLNVEFNGCVNNGSLTVTSTTEAHAAGIAGYVMKMQTSDTSIVKVINCTNTGKISATSTEDGRANVGGIISTAHQGTFTITDCTNTGAVSGTDASTKNQACVGGIVGRANAMTTLNNCSNSGEITAAATQTNAKAYAGAVVGHGNISGVIKGFSNTGLISGPDTYKALTDEEIVLIAYTGGKWTYDKD